MVENLLSKPECHNVQRLREACAGLTSAEGAWSATVHGMLANSGCIFVSPGCTPGSGCSTDTKIGHKAVGFDSHFRAQKER